MVIGRMLKESTKGLSSTNLVAHRMKAKRMTLSVSKEKEEEGSD